MIKLKNLLFFFTLSIIIATGGMARSECDPSDGNNTEADAQPIGLDETVSGVVCPDDPFDFYTFDIKEGSDISGQIEFSSPQVSTVIRVYHDVTGDRIIDDKFTNETTKDYVFAFDPGSIPRGLTTYASSSGPTRLTTMITR